MLAGFAERAGEGQDERDSAFGVDLAGVEAFEDCAVAKLGDRSIPEDGAARVDRAG
jgi:hypothetical protein